MKFHRRALSPAMMLAWMHDIKTQTRRLDGLAKVNDEGDYWLSPYGRGRYGCAFTREDRYGRIQEAGVPMPIRPGNAIAWCEAIERVGDDDHGVAYYRTDAEIVLDAGTRAVPWTWKPRALAARYCPSRCIREFAEVIAVRCERLKDLTAADAYAEGVMVFWNGDDFVYEVGQTITSDPVDAFAALWDGLNERRGFEWDSDPYVWALFLERHDLRWATKNGWTF